MAMPTLGLNLFGGITGWLMSGGAIIAVLGGVYLYGRHDGAESIRLENANALAALNATVNDLNGQLLTAERLADASREMAAQAVKASPHVSCVPSADVVAKLNGVH